MKTIYKWTGEYRPPKKGEWYLNIMVAHSTRGVIFYPLEAAYDCDDCHWILDRQEIEEE